MKQKCHVDLYTREGEQLSGTPWDAYPRPQLRRDSYYNLNGAWDFAVSTGDELPMQYDEKIRIPFPPQSLLSGIHRDIPEEQYLFYRRSFRWPEEFGDGRVILHIGAADQIAAVWLNGIYLGEHVGGYEPFSFDVTEALKRDNTLVIRVTDQMSRLVLPYGKQSRKRGGMWYTPVSGIWQTVWLERVPEQYVRGVKIRNGLDWAELTVEGGVSDGTVTVHTPEGELEFLLREGKAEIKVPEPRCWSPEDPYLYFCTIRAGEDRVTTYFALRTLTRERVAGVWRLCLNGKPCFFHGLLDQGYWSDGLFTPAHPSCYERDILAAKALGFNTLRKHIKVEPEQFYYDCDRLGMVVFQDMVNNGDYNFLRDTALPTVGWRRRNDRRMHRDKETREAFLNAMEGTVERLSNHPCICYWTIFNEGWGQFESTKAYRRLKELDPTRFVAGVSGWFKGGESDVEAEHIYFRPFRPKKVKRPLVLSEFGGYAYQTKGHVFNPDNEYGYRKYDDREVYVQGLVELYRREIIPAVGRGLCGAVYTQLSDVEDETNGLLSYDRKVCKVKPEELLPIAEALEREIHRHRQKN